MAEFNPQKHYTLEQMDEMFGSSRIKQDMNSRVGTTPVGSKKRSFFTDSLKGGSEGLIKKRDEVGRYKEELKERLKKREERTTKEKKRFDNEDKDMFNDIKSWVLRHKGFAEDEIMPPSEWDVTRHTEDKGYIPDPSFLAPSIKKGGNVFGFKTKDDFMSELAAREGKPTMEDVEELDRIEEMEKFVDESFKSQSKDEYNPEFQSRKITKAIRKTKIDPEVERFIEKFDSDQLSMLYTLILKPNEDSRYSLANITKKWDTLKLSEKERKRWIADSIVNSLLNYPTMQLHDTKAI